MRGAECWTDHHLVRAVVNLQLRPPVRKKKPSKKMNVSACRAPDVQQALQAAIQESLQLVDEVDPSLPRNTDALIRVNGKLLAAVSKNVLQTRSASVPKTIRTGLMTTALTFMNSYKPRMQPMTPNCAIPVRYYCTKSGKNSALRPRKSCA